MTLASLRVGLAVTALSLAALSTAARAQDTSGTNATEATGDAGPVSRIAMAQDLYDYGMEQRDALSVLAAANILAAIDTRDVEREKETRDAENAAAVEDEGEGVDTPVSAEQMLADAEALAGDDAALQSLIADARAAGNRGRVAGPSRTLSRLPAGKVDIWVIPFDGGRFAEIAIVGDGDANLDALVTDENGNTICIDRSWSDKLYCSFTPAWTGNFVITVANNGRLRNSYYLLTN